MSNSIFRKDGTAQGVAKQRLIESLAKPSKRIIYDPYAENFVLGAGIIKLMGHNFSVWLSKKFVPGFHEHLISRTRFIDDLIKKSNNQQSRSYCEDYAEVTKKLEELEKVGQKTILFGVSYALLDLAEQFPQKLKHTIIIETGGTKGNRKEILKEELHHKLKKAFSLEKIDSEYGMTELLSQSYSNGNGIFKSPNWKKILIRDINDPLSIVGENKIGGINIIDLANIYSCPFIATQDLGKTFDDDTFKVLGRINNADLRGCNLLAQ